MIVGACSPRRPARRSPDRSRRALTPSRSTDGVSGSAWAPRRRRAPAHWPRASRPGLRRPPAPGRGWSAWSMWSRTVDCRRDGRIKRTRSGLRRRVTAATGKAWRRLARWRRPMLPEPIRRTVLTTSDHLECCVRRMYQRRGAGGRRAPRGERRVIRSVEVRYARGVVNGPILFLVPVRGGSRRVPGQEPARRGRLPLVGRAVVIARPAAASLSGGPHRVVCSTDDAAIARVAAAWGAEVIDRPPALATAGATSVLVVLHAIGDVAAGQPRCTDARPPPAHVTPGRSRRPRRGGRAALGGGGAPVTSVTATHPARGIWRRTARGCCAP